MSTLRRSVLVLFTAVGVLCVADAASATTYTCGTNGVNNSCTPALLTTLIAGAVDGDTINIARATHAWTIGAPVLVNKKITISGGGQCVSGCGDVETPTYQAGARLDTGSVRAFTINVPSSGSGLVRVTGIHFNGSPTFTYVFSDSGSGGLFGAVYNSNRASCRVDNNHMQSSNGNGGWYVNSYCLLDHNWFHMLGTQGHTLMVLYQGASGNGDEVWAQNPAPGSANFPFIEDNTFTKADASIGDQSCIDSYVGGNYVARYNYFKGCDVLNHDKSGGGNTRAGQFFEVYGNTFVSPSGSYHTAMFWREGNVYMHNNTFLGPWQSILKLWNQRVTASLGNWGVCDGSKSWDSNIGPSGYRCADQVGTGKANGLGRANTQPQARFQTRVWNNNTSGLTSSRNCTSSLQHGGLVCNTSPTTIVDGVDYILSTDSSAAPAGYTPYPYPHPLQSATGGSGPAAPANLRIISSN